MTTPQRTWEGLDEPMGAKDSAANARTIMKNIEEVFIDPSTWLNLPDDARRQAEADHEIAATTLLRSGWRVVSVRHGESLTALWPQAARGSQSFAWRAAMAETVAAASALGGSIGGTA